MKKIFVVLAAMFAVFVMFGCTEEAMIPENCCAEEEVLDMDANASKKIVCRCPFTVQCSKMGVCMCGQCVIY